MATCGSCKLRDQDVAHVRDCYAELDAQAAEQRAELYAEAVMDWVCSGGSPEDAGRYASVIARGEVWDGGVGDMEFSGEKCEHGQAKELCEGPQHYPLDDPSDW